jgi:hypothetical protein
MSCCKRLADCAVRSVLNDVWQFSLANSSWSWIGGSNGYDATVSYTGTQDPGARELGASWVLASDQTKLYYFGGHYTNGQQDYAFMSDMWVFSLTSHSWTYLGGPQVGSIVANYSNPQWPGPRFGASTWDDGVDNLYLYGGEGYTTSNLIASGALNDIWRYTVSTGTWTFLSGTTVLNTTNIPGLPDARRSASIWRPVSAPDTVLMFGGLQLSSVYNDLWAYSISGSSISHAAFAI